MARRIKGNGTATFRGDNSCRVQFCVEDTATGEVERKGKTMRVKSRSQAEKKRCIREFREELEQSLLLREGAQGMTFAQYAQEWQEARAADPEIAPRTVKKDADRIKTLNLTFGKMRIGEIERRDVRRFQTAVMTADKDGKAPTLSGRPVSGTTARGYRITLKQILQEAVRDGVILKNPCDDLKAPSVDTKEKEPMSLEDVSRFRALLDASRPRPSLVAFRLMLFAGLRRGEVVALQWKDYDAQAGTISVRRAIDNETLQFKDTKTDAGRRVIPLDASTIDYLNRFKVAQAAKLEELGFSVDDSCVAATVGTAFMQPENVTRSLARFCAANGFEHFTPHLLRHTYCTLLFAAGVDLKTVQYLMGHKDPATTLRVYTHYVERNGVKAAAAVGALVNSLPASNVVKLEVPKGRWGISAAVI